jgi:hypothetical protein
MEGLDGKLVQQFLCKLNPACQECVPVPVPTNSASPEPSSPCSSTIRPLRRLAEFKFIRMSHEAPTHATAFVEAMLTLERLLT